MIQILCVRLSELTEDQYKELYRQASPARKARADRCRAFISAARCITADALIRFSLREFCGCDTPFHEVCSPAGKPTIAQFPDFHYNLSHSGDWVVIAWGKDPVGVDIQEFSAKSPDALARRYFAPEEQQYLFSKESEAERIEAFFQIFTAKESYVKYLGTGITKDFSRFQTLNPDMLGVSLQHIPMDSAHLCLCSRDPDYRLRYLSPEELV